MRSERWSGLVTQVLTAKAALSVEERRAIFDAARENVPGGPGDLAALVETVGRHAYRVTDPQVARLVASGRNEDEVYDAIVVTAFGAAQRRLDVALGAMGRS